jgi:hypothetical protein
MTVTQVKLVPPRFALRKLIIRTLAVLAAAAVIGFGMRQAAAALERSPQPAGFVRGVVQGALMPCALPNLLVGSDVAIYAQRNTGVPYKLGYTCGVNACGAVFFGLFFWRLNQWRKRRGNGS